MGCWHVCGMPLNEQQAGIVQSYLQTPLVFFSSEVCYHAIFTICDVHLRKSNRNSSLKLNACKPFKIQGGLQAVPANGSLSSAFGSCCPAITATLLIGLTHTVLGRLLINCVLLLITNYMMEIVVSKVIHYITHIRLYNQTTFNYFRPNLLIT